MTSPARVKTKQRGFTLIELIIFIVVVSAGLTGILSVMNTIVKSSADPMVRKQALVLAESVTEEIMLKNYCDPDQWNMSTTPPTCAFPARESARDIFDNVDDYAGIDEVISSVGPIFLDMPAVLNGYRIQIVVETSTLGAAVPARKVTVTTSRGSDSVSIVSYRTCYGEDDSGTAKVPANRTDVGTCPH